jgi:hypothetical protein
MFVWIRGARFLIEQDHIHDNFCLGQKMKRTVSTTLFCLLLLASFAIPAQAAQFTYDFLFNGDGSWSTLNSSGRDAYTDVAVTFGFDTATSIGSDPTSKGDSFVFNLADITLKMNGRSWTELAPFRIATEVFVYMTDGVLEKMWLSFANNFGSPFKGYEQEAYLYAELFDVGSFRVSGDFRDEEWANWESTKSDEARISGILTTAPTPIPGAIWLLGSGLVGLVGLRRRMKK